MGWFLMLPLCQHWYLSQPSEPIVGANMAQKHSLLVRACLIVLPSTHGAHPLSSSWVLCQLSCVLDCTTTLHYFAFSCHLLSSSLSVSISPPSVCLVALLMMSFWSLTTYGIPSLKQLLHPLNLSRFLLPWHNTWWTDNAQFMCLQEFWISLLHLICPRISLKWA